MADTHTQDVDQTTDGAVGGEGGDATDSGVQLPQWVTSQLPEDLHLEDLAGYTKPADAIRALVETKGKLDGAIIPPGDGATEEEIAAYRERLGIPADADAYSFDDLELPEGQELDQETIGEFRKQALKAGLTNDQARELAVWYAQKEADGRKAFDAELTRKREETTATLKKEWGDQYDGNVRLMRKALSSFGDEEFNQYLDESGLGNDPRLVKAFVKIGQAMVNDSLVGGSVAGGQPSREELLKQMYPKMAAQAEARG